MAGHSKWANIKHRKERADQKKGKLFSKLAKEIISAVKQGGSDPKANIKLKLALQKAKDANLPKETIQRNIDKALDPGGSNYTEVSYELYGHGGVGIIAEGMTDNKNRMASEMKIATNKCGGAIGEPGSVSYNFDRKGVIQISSKNIDEDEIFLLVSEMGADDFESKDGTCVITTPPESLYKIKEELDTRGIKSEVEISQIPKLSIQCNPEDQEANFKLIEWLENIEDVDEVYDNMEV